MATKAADANGKGPPERKLFGTDGIRGVANVYPMTAEMALAVGRAAAHVFKRNPGQRHRIVIGKDTRLSGYMIETALTSGICSMGVDVLLVGPLPTPAIAFLTESMRCDAGVVISASHNPFPDNGIKFFAHDGYKLPDEVEAEMEHLVFSDAIDSLRPTAQAVGKAYRIDDAIGRYIVWLKSAFPSHLTLDGLKVVLDCAHGAAYKAAPAVFSELGAEVISLGVAPNGENINVTGALHPEHMAAAVVEHGADIGIALDGDADRVIFADEHGQIVDGDAVMAVVATNWLGRRKLKKRTLVTTVMSNMGLDLAVEKAGGKVVRVRVGDRYVVEAMRSKGYNFGGEQSGHLVFLDHATTGDGVIAALQILAILVEKRKTLSELASGSMERLPQILRNVPVREKKGLEELPRVSEAIAHAEKTLGAKGRVLFRYSGTENLARVLVEGQREQTISDLADTIVEELERALGA